MNKRISIALVALCVIGIAAGLFATRDRHHKIRHIVLISIDTCRADHLSCYGYPKNTTPHIDAIAREATRFEYAISPVPMTFPAHCSMLTGRIPPAHGVHDNTNFQLSPKNRTLAEILQQHGYGTAAIISSFVLDGSRGLNQGFDTYNDFLEGAHYSKDIVGNERLGDSTTRLALDWLGRNQDKKSFLFLHYYDPHLDYAPPEPYATEYSDHPYAGEIAFVDECIGQVVDQLKTLGLYDSTLLIITGDHGEMLGEHGEDEHSYFIYESAIQVPLIIRMPGQEKPLTIAQPVSLVDLLPTICSLLNIALPSEIQGWDISGFLQGNVPDNYERNLYSESVMAASQFGSSTLMAISTGRWKFIQAPRPELYDLIHDRAEENNLAEQEPHRTRILADRLRQTLEHSIRNEQNSRIELDAESIRRLESLGYIAGKSQGELAFDETKTDPKDYIHVYNEFHKARKLFEQNDFVQAEKILRSIVSECTTYHRPYLVLGDIAMRRQDFNEAILNYRRARMIKPDMPKDLNTCNIIAWLQATRPSLTSRDVEEAVLLAKRACTMTKYSNPSVLDTLATAYAAAGDFPKAIETARQAYELARTINTEMARKISVRLALFEQSIPYVEK